jgi:tetraacyldisaccharide 4'-kinase
LASEAVQPDGTRCALRNLPGPVLAVAGIAQPQAFFDMLRAHGVAPAKTLALPDHHDFANLEPQTWQGYTVVCTEKDAVKLQRMLPQAWAVPLLFAPPPAFFAALDQALNQALAAALDEPHEH